jgi:NAD-dependent SIR2 family protein deacetylase
MWTNRDAGTSYDKSKYVETISSALPTLSHMALAELVHRGIVKSIISTNVDGLHMRSGVPFDKLAELHGNSYLETCNKCGHKYLRGNDILQYQTEDHRLVNRHWCGGKCEQPGCDGLLLDTIVAFGEFLPEDQLNFAQKQSNKGDFALVLGTTMMVQPACLLPGYIYKKPGGKMVICNLQKTSYDNQAALTIHGQTDDFIYLVMKELGIEIPRSTDSFVIPNYKEEIDNKHLMKRELIKKQLEEIEREKRENPGGRSNAITKGQNPTGDRDVISGKSLNKEFSFSTTKLVFFNNCRNSNLILKSKSKKVVIEDCHDTTITLNEKIITNTIEIINSSNLMVYINVPVFTLTCDNSKSISISFKSADYFEMVAWAKAENCRLLVGDLKIDFTSGLTYDINKDQIVTRKQTDGTIISSLTRRDQSGRIVELVQT